MTEQIQRKPIEILAQPSKYEGFTTDILVNGCVMFSIDLDDISESGILAIVSESIQIGAHLLLKDMGKFVNDISDEEH